MVVLKTEQIMKDPQRITKILPLLNLYEWKNANFSSHAEDWNTFKKTIIQVLSRSVHSTQKERDNTSIHWSIWLNG